METPQPKAEGDDAAETPTQKQARLRRERREAKLKSDGTSRLEQIAKVSGRQNLPDLPPNIGQVSEDPDEVDLSSHPSAARTPNLQQSQSSGGTKNGGGPPTEADIRAMLRAGAPQPGADKEGEGNPEEGEDPMMKMLSQLMGGGMPNTNGQGDGGSRGSGEGGLPPGLAAMLGAGGGGIPGMMGGGDGATAMQEEKNTYAYLWKIVHAVFALCLGVYVTATSTALLSGSITRGSPRQGLLEEMPDRQGLNLFFVFATMELVLQSSRFFFEKEAGAAGGQLGGWFRLVAGFLPEPYRGYLFLVGRYARIWGTVVEDAMVIVFVVGCVAWWKGAVG